MDIEVDTFKVISDYIQAILGIRPWLMEEDFPRPSGPYIGCKLLNIEKLTVGSHRVDNYSEDGVEKYACEYILRWHIQSFRDGAMESLMEILSKMNDKTSASILSAGGLAYKGSTRITQTTMTREGTVREKQAIVVVEFYYVREGTNRVAPLTIEESGGVTFVNP